ncbi:MAG: hypothetical protein JWM87_2046 [Candidatus Eremiobacteraeota bacterium]|nr:hypothetical protein [Candidatus Eremiobacteraeota bacterium]
MPKTRVSVTVEREVLDEFKELAGKDAKLSAVMTEALRREIRRLGMLAYLEEREREHPISPEGRAAGERLWKTVVLSLTPEYYPQSRKAKKQCAPRSRKR